jgi:hypothetical protein
MCARARALGIRSIVRTRFVFGQRINRQFATVAAHPVLDPLRTSRMVDVDRSIAAMPRVAGVGTVSKSDGYPSENETSVYDRLVRCVLACS